MDTLDVPRCGLVAAYQAPLINTKFIQGPYGFRPNMAHPGPGYSFIYTVAPPISSEMRRELCKRWRDLGGGGAVAGLRRRHFGPLCGISRKKACLSSAILSP